LITSSLFVLAAKITHATCGGKRLPKGKIKDRKEREMCARKKPKGSFEEPGLAGGCK
jgi:hypothetical protein